MCQTCGCNVTSGNEHLVRHGGKLSLTEDGKPAVEVLTKLLAENDHQADHNRAHFGEHGVLAVNLMSSPGAGKTALLEATIEAMGEDCRIGVIEGDLETENDADRIRARGVPAIQITTGTACHLDAHMVHDALHHMDLATLDIVFIENVGNLVCPASFDLGHHRNVALLSVPEGDDKPSKYPVMFRAADLVLVTKTDLLPYMDEFAPKRVETNLRALASEAPVLELSSRRQSSLDGWVRWLREQLENCREAASHNRTLRPAMQPESTSPHTHGHGHAHGGPSVAH